VRRVRAMSAWASPAERSTQAPDQDLLGREPAARPRSLAADGAADATLCVDSASFEPAKGVEPVQPGKTGLDRCQVRCSPRPG